MISSFLKNFTFPFFLSFVCLTLSGHGMEEASKSMLPFSGEKEEYRDNRPFLSPKDSKEMEDCIFKLEAWEASLERKAQFLEESREALTSFKEVFDHMDQTLSHIKKETEKLSSLDPLLIREIKPLLFKEIENWHLFQDHCKGEFKEFSKKFSLITGEFSSSLSRLDLLEGGGKEDKGRRLRKLQNQRNSVHESLRNMHLQMNFKSMASALLTALKLKRKIGCLKKALKGKEIKKEPGDYKVYRKLHRLYAAIKKEKKEARLYVLTNSGLKREERFRLTMDDLDSWVSNLFSLTDLKDHVREKIKFFNQEYIRRLLIKSSGEATEN